MIRTLVRYDITICGIPELDLHCEAGVSDVLSIIDPYEPEPPVFARFQPHRRQTATNRRPTRRLQTPN